MSGSHQLGQNVTVEVETNLYGTIKTYKPKLAEGCTEVQKVAVFPLLAKT